VYLLREGDGVGVKAIGGLVVLELAALLVLGGVTVAKFRVWADVDERPHYDYVQRVAEEQELPRLDARLMDGVLPQEWIVQLGVWWVRGVVDGLALLLVAAAVALLVARRREWRAWFLALPFLSGVLLMNAVYVLTGNDSTYLRYLYPALVPLAVGIGLAAARLPVGRLRVAAIAAVGLVVAVLWVDMAGAFYFNDVGRRLGIV
jgi:hypothetical protein